MDIMKRLKAIGVSFGKLVIGGNGKSVLIRWSGDKQLAGLKELVAKATVSGAMIVAGGDDWNLVHNPAGDAMRNSDGTARITTINGIPQPELRVRDRFVLLTAVSYDSLDQAIEAG